MSRSEINKVVKEWVNVCDVCGVEIEESGAYDDENFKARMKPLKEATDWRDLVEIERIERVTFTWPFRGSKRKKRLDEERREETGRPSASAPMEDYDFHGECIANLIKTAVKMRKEQGNEDLGD